MPSVPSCAALSPIREEKGSRHEASWLLIFKGLALLSVFDWNPRVAEKARPAQIFDGHQSAGLHELLRTEYGYGGTMTTCLEKDQGSGASQSVPWRRHDSSQLASVG